MAVGDVIKLGSGRTETWLRRFDAPDGPGAIGTGLLKAAAFTVQGPRNDATPPGRWPWLRRRGRDRSAGAALSLPALASQETTVFRVGFGSGGIGVEVPYAHLALAAGFDPPGAFETIAGDLQADLEPRWRSYLDPIIGLRTALYRDPDRRDERLSLFVGKGVFVPHAEERPVGRVEFALSGESGGWIEPTLPDGRPAGIYRGQSAIALADRTDGAPASCRLLDDPNHLYVIQLERSSRWRPGQVSGDVCLETVALRPLSAHDMRPEIEALAPPPGFDAAFAILRDGTPHLQVRVVRDARVSALRHQMPPGERCLDIVGLLAPDRQSVTSPVKRWWLDLDGQDQLVSAAWTTVERSIIFKGETVESYDWRSNRFRTGSTPAFTFERRTIAGRDRSLVRRVDGAALGRLAPPPTPHRVEFRPVGGAGAYGLDWLDFAGAVEPSLAEPLRLAEVLAAGATDASASQVPSVDQVAQMTPGYEFFLGPLQVRVGGVP